MENKLTLEEKIELAIWLCEHNSNLALTGSLMLYLRQRPKKIEDFILKREPQDIDFIINASDEDAKNELILPPFIEKYETQFSDYDGYEVLARFWYRGTKVEFIESPHFRYDKDFVGSSWYGNKKSLAQDFSSFHNHHYNIRLALISDLIVAKKSYIEVDKNEDYLNKTKKDLELLNNFYQKSYKDEYVTIIKSYLDHSWYYSKKTTDLGRKFIEQLIWKYEVSNYESREEWYKYIINIDHNWHEAYIEYRRKRDPYYSKYGYGIDYEEQKMIDKMIYSYNIPFNYELQNFTKYTYTNKIDKFLDELDKKTI